MGHLSHIVELLKTRYLVPSLCAAALGYRYALTHSANVSSSWFNLTWSGSDGITCPLRRTVAIYQWAICMTVSMETFIETDRRLSSIRETRLSNRLAPRQLINSLSRSCIISNQPSAGRVCRKLERWERGRCSVLPGARADRCLRSVSWEQAFSVTAIRSVVATSRCKVEAHDLFGFERRWRGKRN